MAAGTNISRLFEQADALEQRGLLDLAEQTYRDILQQQPRHFFALHALGNLLTATGRPDPGADLLAKAVKINPGAAPAHCNLGRALHAAGRHDRALQSLNRAIALQPDMAEAHNNRGNLLRDLGRPAEALASYERAIHMRPAFAEAHTNRGNMLETLNRSEEAVASHDRALAHDPDNATAHFNRGVSLASLFRLTAAIASYDRALALQPDFAVAHVNRAHALLDLTQHEAALKSCDAALALEPDCAGAHYNRGLALLALGRHSEAITSLERALTLAPDQEFLPGDLLSAQLQACDWRDFDARSASLLAGIKAGRRVAMPFTVMTLTDDPALQLAAARATVMAKYPPLAPALPAHPQAADGRIRIGYFSADFRNHPVADLMVEVFERHDATRFETIGYGFGPPSTHPMRARIEAAFARFHDVRDLSDSDVAALARTHRIDIAIDLGGHSIGGRPGIFARRAAPVQVSYIGYVGTTGAEYIDYVIADPMVIPEAEIGHFSEHVIHLPIYQANPATRESAAETPTRAALDLPEDGFVFCCFNANHKILPAQFDRWMEILARCQGSVLWLQAGNAVVTANLRAEAAARGIDPARLIFAPRAPYADYMQQLSLADLFLDTHPYNAGASASDALWAGLPVLTRPGRSYASRMAASLLHAVGLPEMVVPSDAEYVEQAVHLATAPHTLKAMAQRLAATRRTAALFDTQSFTRTLEAAYATIHQRARKGVPPGPVTILQETLA